MAGSIAQPLVASAATPPADYSVIRAEATRARRTFSLDDLRARPSEKLVFCFWGGKGAGKSRTAFTLPGRVLVLSFDHKSEAVRLLFPEEERNRFWIVDAIQHYSEQPELAPSSAATTIDFLIWTMEEVAKRFHPHWVLFDGGEVVEELADQKMRFLHGLAYSQGFKQTAWWKDRRGVLRDLFSAARRVSLMGVAFTTYYERSFADEGSTTVREGTGTNKNPKWLDVFMRESDVSIECRFQYSQLAKRNHYETYVQSSKGHTLDIAKTGDILDTTDKGFGWGPGLAARLAKVDERTKGLTVEYQQFSDVPAESVVILPQDPPTMIRDVGESDEMPPVPSPGPSMPAAPVPVPSAPLVPRDPTQPRRAGALL